MKRSELKVGMAVAYQRSLEWDSPEKVTVLAVEPYKTNSRWFNAASTVPHYIPVASGNGVLVERINGQRAYQDVIQLTQLRGRYDEIKAEWDVTREAAKEAANAAAQARDVAQERAAALVTALGESWQVRARIEGWERPRVILDLDEAQKLLDLLDKLDPR